MLAPKCRTSLVDVRRTTRLSPHLETVPCIMNDTTQSLSYHSGSTTARIILPPVAPCITSPKPLT